MGTVRGATGDGKEEGGERVALLKSLEVKAAEICMKGQEVVVESEENTKPTCAP